MEDFMNRKRKTFIFFMIINMVLLSGCNNKKIQFSSENSSYIKKSELKTSITSAAGEITKMDYDNLDLSKVSVEFPDITEYHNLRLFCSNDMNIDERIEYIRNMTEKFFPKHIYSDNYLSWWGVLPGINEKSYPNGWIKYPSVSDNKEAITNLNFNGGSFLYESDAEAKHEHDVYMLLNPQTLVGTIIKGTGKKITDGDYEHLAGWFPAYTYENIERCYIDSLPNVSYKLSDTEVSISEAVSYAVNFFRSDYVLTLPETFIYPEVSAVDICKFNDVYGYRFLMRNTFENISFDYTYDLGTVSEMSDGNFYSNFTNEAFMAMSNDIDFWYMQQPYTRVEYDGEAINDIIPLDEALRIMSDKLTKSVTFEVSRVDFVYCPLDFEENSYETTAEAAWRIESLNPNDGKTYIVYVNATDSELRYYTRI